MRAFCEFNMETGELVQRGTCADSCVPRIRKNNAIAFVATSSIFDTVTFITINSGGVALNPVLHKATKEEKANRTSKKLEPRKIFSIDDNNVPAAITKKQWRDIENRIATLEND